MWSSSASMSGVSARVAYLVSRRRKRPAGPRRFSDSEYALRLEPQLLRSIECRQGVPVDAGVQRRGVGVAPETLHTILLVNSRCADFEEDVVDNLGRGPRGKTVIATDAHALLDVERAAGAHDFLCLLQT